MFSERQVSTKGDGFKAGWGGLCLAFFVSLGAIATDRAIAIDVNISMEEAKKALAAGREPMLIAYDVKDQDEQRKQIAGVLSKAVAPYEARTDEGNDPCGPRVLFGTKRFTLEEYGRKEAKETVRQKKEVRMPDKFIKKVIGMPIMQIEVHLCGDDEYFAEGAEVAFQQNSKNIRPIDVSPAQKGRKNEGKGPAYRSRFTARFSYDSFDSMAKTKVIVFFPDGKLMEIPADFSKIR